MEKLDKVGEEVEKENDKEKDWGSAKVEEVDEEGDRGRKREKI